MILINRSNIFIPKHIAQKTIEEMINQISLIDTQNFILLLYKLFMNVILDAGSLQLSGVGNMCKKSSLKLFIL